MTATVQPTGAAALTREIAATRRALADGERAWKSEHARLQAEARRLTEARELVLQGVSVTEQEVAERIVLVRGRLAEATPGAFPAAVDALAAGGLDLLNEYIGSKRYDGFHQRCDCQYGYGPRHGSIVFAVELTQNVRQRMRETGEPLTEDEREAAVRYLLAREAAEASQ